jgi:hypothetical protein
VSNVDGSVSLVLTISRQHQGSRIREFHTCREGQAGEARTSEDYNLEQLFSFVEEEQADSHTSSDVVPRDALKAALKVILPFAPFRPPDRTRKLGQ